MEKACEAASVKRRGLHALRHSFASNLYARGMEVKIIWKLLGRSCVEIIDNRYTHFLRVPSTTHSGRRLGCAWVRNKAEILMISCMKVSALHSPKI